MERCITITGNGTASGVPDIATLNISVTTEDRASSSARKSNNVITNKLQKFLLAFVEHKDIKTLNLSVQPSTQYDERTHKNNITGYYCQHTLLVTIRNLDLVDDVIDGASELGNQVSVGNLSFDVADKEGMYREARVQAVNDAMEKAQLYCETAGVMLGKLSSLTEQHQPRAYGGAIRKMAVACSAEMDDGTNVAAGESSVNIQVNCQFSIED